MSNPPNHADPPIFLTRRRIVDTTDSAFAIYNSSSALARKSTLNPRIPEKPPLSFEISLFCVHRTQWFSSRHPFLGHAPASDCSFTGALTSLNVNHSQEHRFRKSIKRKTKTKNPTELLDAIYEKHEKEFALPKVKLEQFGQSSILHTFLSLLTLFSRGCSP